MRDLTRWSVLGLSGLAIIAATGCARSIAVVPPSLDRHEAAAQSIADNDRVPFVLDTFHMSQNGAPQHPSSDIERRVLNAVQETRLFSTLVPFGGTPSTLGGKTVAARLTFDETVDPHAGHTALKGIVIGASMFLLSPIIELDYDYAAQAGLEVERWDGQVSRYEARSSGTARYNLFGASPIIIDELKGQVTEACLNDLMAQLVRDTTLYMASKIPLPASTIRTVTVRARRPAAAQTPLPTVQVSTTPVP